MPGWVWFIIGSIASTFVGALFFAILAARGVRPIDSIAAAFEKTSVARPAPTVA